MSDEQYTNLSNISTPGKVIADEQVETPIVKATTVIADEIKKNDGKTYALTEYVDAEVSKKPDRETTTNGGISRISNTSGDEGACLTFVHNDTSISGIGVNNKGLNGIAAQIYALDGSKSGTRINVTQQKIYYTKKGDATYTDIDEIVTFRDLEDTKAVWGQITGNMSDQTDLSTKFKAVDDATALVDTKITAETERATTAETKLTNDLTAEVSRATVIENKTITDLSNEITRATTEEKKKVNKTSKWGNGHEGWFNSEEDKIEVIYKGDKDPTSATGNSAVSGFHAYNSQDPTQLGIHIVALKGENGNHYGSSIMGYNDKFFYTSIGNATGSRPNDEFEIATIGDVQKLSGTFRGNFNTHADLLAYAGEKYKNDYAIVQKDETHDNQVARYSYNGTAWEFEYAMSSDFIKLLGKEPHSGEEYHFPFNINPLVQESKQISTTFDTITLDNNKTVVSYPIVVPSADPVNDKSGLYNKELADKKLTILGSPAPGVITYHIPFDFTQEAHDKYIQLKLNTVTLDNNETKIEFAEERHRLLSADIDNDKAGLYNKELADKKADRLTAISNGKSYVSNLAGDEGAVLKFENNDGTWSGIGVNNGGASGIAGQIYAVDGATKMGTRINVTKGAVYYTAGKSDPTYTADDEIATIRDVKSLGGTFRGNFATKADLLAYTGPKEENDYAIVDKDESQTPPGDCWRYRYSFTTTSWTPEYKVREQDVIKLLGNEAGSGEPYHFTYFYTVTPNEEAIKVGIETITLDNNKMLKHYDMDVPAMDYANAKAGLYTKSLADRKTGVFKGKFDTIELLPTDAVKNDYAYVFKDLEHENGPSIRTFDGTAWVYDYSLGGNDAIKLLGKVPGTTEEYNLPYFFYTDVQAEKIVAHAKTVSLDNNKVQGDYPMDILPADIENNKAGLYTKTLADKKLDIPGTVPGNPSEILRLPFFFEQEVQADKVIVKSHTVKLDNTKNKVDEVFTMDVASADIENDKAGLYNKALADKKIDKLGKAFGDKDYEFPFNIFDPVQNPDTITAVFQTIELNDQTKKYDRTITLPSADVTTDKAGLYNKSIHNLLMTEIKTRPKFTDALIPEPTAVEQKFAGHEIGDFALKSDLGGEEQVAYLSNVKNILGDTSTSGTVCYDVYNLKNVMGTETLPLGKTVTSSIKELLEALGNETTAGTILYRLKDITDRMVKLETNGVRGE